MKVFVCGKVLKYVPMTKLFSIKKSFEEEEEKSGG